MTNTEIAGVLKQTAALMELTGSNPFRIRAYSGAARTIERMEAPVVDLAAAGDLTSVKGIGEGLAAQIEDLLTTGSFSLLDDLLASLPPGLLDMLQVKGLGAKRVRYLWKEAGISSLDELEAAGRAGRLAALDGFGTKTQASILDNIERLRAYQQQRRYADAVLLAAPLVARLEAANGVEAVYPTGPFRRCFETLDRIDLMAVADSTADVQAALPDSFSEGTSSPADGAQVYEGHVETSFPARIVVASPTRWATILWRTTGPEAFCEAFAERAGTVEEAIDEADLFKQAALPLIPPELRDQEDILDVAEQGDLPDLLTVADLQGNLHNHSTYSDGTHSLKQMADATRSLGYAYFGICDHSRSLKVANGMPINRVREQHTEIERLNAAYATDGGTPFRIFAGIESDILADGSLDYPEDVLATFDFVVASVHTGFNMTREEATTRILTAVANPFTTILGHPTGRLLLRRPGYPVDHEQIIAACAEHDVAIELNANPYRLDLDWRWIRKATDQGVRIAINPDAHAMDQLDYVKWGVAVARKGGLTARQCLNALPLDAFTDWLAARRPVTS